MTDNKEKKKNGIYVENSDNGASVHISVKDGIHVENPDEGESVHVSKSGVHVHDKDGTNVDVSTAGVYVNGQKKDYHIHWSKLDAVYPILTVIIYLILGFTVAFHPWWIIFLTIPLVRGCRDCVKNRSLSHFPFAVLITIVYLCLGCFLGAWHPWWVLFLSIPVWYILIGKDDKKTTEESTNETKE